MTFDEALDLPQNTPILLKDGRFGIVIRWWQPDEIGVQVLGEEHIRTIKVKNVISKGDNALLEVCLKTGNLN